MEHKKISMATPNNKSSFVKTDFEKAIFDHYTKHGGSSPMGDITPPHLVQN